MLFKATLQFFWDFYLQILIALGLYFVSHNRDKKRERERDIERQRKRDRERERVALFCFTQQGIKLQEKILSENSSLQVQQEKMMQTCFPIKLLESKLLFILMLILNFKKYFLVCPIRLPLFLLFSCVFM